MLELLAFLWIGLIVGVVVIRCCCCCFCTDRFFRDAISYGPGLFCCDRSVVCLDYFVTAKMTRKGTFCCYVSITYYFLSCMRLTNKISAYKSTVLSHHPSCHPVLSDGWNFLFFSVMKTRQQESNSADCCCLNYNQNLSVMRNGSHSNDFSIIGFAFVTEMACMERDLLILLWSQIVGIIMLQKRLAWKEVCNCCFDIRVSYASVAEMAVMNRDSFLLLLCGCDHRFSFWKLKMADMNSDLLLLLQRSHIL